MAQSVQADSRSQDNASSRTGASYAWTNRHDLPGAPSRLDNIAPAKTGFGGGDGRADGNGAANKSSDAAREARRQSFMVQRSQPVPVLRPGPQLSLGADRAAFNARWAREADEAQDHAANPSRDRDARRAAFMAQRTANDHSTSQTFNRSNRRAR